METEEESLSYHLLFSLKSVKFDLALPVLWPFPASVHLLATDVITPPRCQLGDRHTALLMSSVSTMV